MTGKNSKELHYFITRLTNFPAEFLENAEVISIKKWDINPTGWPILKTKGLELECFAANQDEFPKQGETIQIQLSNNYQDIKPISEQNKNILRDKNATYNKYILSGKIVHIFEPEYTTFNIETNNLGKTVLKKKLRTRIEKNPLIILDCGVFVKVAGIKKPEMGKWVEEEWMLKSITGHFRQNSKLAGANK